MKRQCAKCGNEYPEIDKLWPQFPQCSLCRQNLQEKLEARSPENVFRYWLQVSHGIAVTAEVAKEIMETAKIA